MKRFKITSLILLMLCCIFLLQSVSAAETDTADPSMLWKYQPLTVTEATDVEISYDGKYILSGTKNYRVYLINNNGTPKWDRYTDGAVRGLAISNDGKYLAVGSEGGVLYLFDPDMNEIWSRYLHTPITDLDMPSSADYIVASSSSANLYAYNLKGEQLWTVKIGNGESINAVSVSNDGGLIITGRTNGWIDAYNLYGKYIWSRMMTSSSAQNMYITDIVISPDGSRIIIGSMDGEIIICDRNGVTLHTYNLGRSITSLSTTYDGDTIAVGCDDSYVYLLKLYKTLNTENYELADKYHAPYKVTGVSIKESGDYLAVSSKDGSFSYYKVLSTEPEPTQTPMPTQIVNEKPNTLSINSTPSGAKIYFDGELIGLTPLTMDSVPAGIHTVKLTLEGHSNVVTSVTFEKSGQDSQLNIFLTPIQNNPQSPIPTVSVILAVIFAAAIGVITYKKDKI